MKIVFFNPYGNGDIHMSRSYIQDIVNKLDEYEFFYAQNYNNTRDFVLQDINGLKKFNGSVKLDPSATIFNNGEYTFINTWYGQGNFKYYPSYKGNPAHECSLYIIHRIFKDIYEFLGIEIGDIYNYKPKINFNNLDLSYLSNFIDRFKLFDKVILICSNPVKSQQSVNFDFNPIINKLSLEYSNHLFLTTSNISSRSNIIDVSEVTKNLFDLNDIAYLSTKCDVIVGRSSGPYTFSIIDENLNDKSKTFVSFTNSKIISTTLNDEDFNCKLIWSNNYQINDIISKIKKSL